MSDFCYDGWGRFGFAAAPDSSTLAATYAAYAMGEEAAVIRSQGVPDDAHLYDIVFELTSMATGAGAPSQVSFYLARDSAGTKPLTEIYTVDIVKALGAAAATGGARQLIAADFHSLAGVGPRAFQDLYLIAKHDAASGTSGMQAYLSWRS